MKRPSFQFYPGDWRKNAKLRRCTEAARGAWMDVLCVLHDADEYGIVRWPLADLARAAGVPVKLLRELADKGVLKGADKGAEAYIYAPRHAGRTGDPVTLVPTSDGPVWYCSRFVRDEWVRLRRGSATQFSPTNQPTKGQPKNEPKSEPKVPPKHPIGERQGDGPSSSSSATQIPSDADASGGKPPLPPASPPPPSDTDVVFALGVPLLMAAGVTEVNARRFLGMQRKGNDDAKVAAALQACAAEQIVDPISWLQRRLGPIRTGAKAGKHAGFDQLDYHDGVTADGHLA